MIRIFRTVLEWAKRHPLLVTMIVAALVRVAMYYPSESGDTRRYLGLVDSLLAGNGYGRVGQLDVTHPPIYPLFLAAILLVIKSHFVIRIIQVAISITSCVVVSKAVQKLRPSSSLWAGLLMSFAPPLAHRAGYLLSEVLTVAVMALFCLAVAWHVSQPDKRWQSAFAIGAMCSLLVLSAPAMLFFSFCVGCAMLIMTWRSPSVLVALVGGVLLAMLPWQAHCVYARGMPILTVYDVSGHSSLNSGYAKWVRSWQLWPHEVRVFHYYQDISYFDRAPAYVFESEGERLRLRGLCEQRNNKTISDEDFDRAFAEVASRRKHESPLQYYVSLPVQRSFILWLYMDKLWPAQHEYIGRLGYSAVSSDIEEFGTKRMLLRYGKSLYSTLLAGVTILYAGTFCWFGIRAVARRNLIGTAIVAGVLMYTVVGSITANNDERRNVPYYPALIFLMALGPRHHDNDEVGDGTKQVADSAA